MSLKDETYTPATKAQIAEVMVSVLSSLGLPFEGVRETDQPFDLAINRIRKNQLQEDSA